MGGGGGGGVRGRDRTLSIYMMGTAGLLRYVQYMAIVSRKIEREVGQLLQDTIFL